MLRQITLIKYEMSYEHSFFTSTIHTAKHRCLLVEPVVIYFNCSYFHCQWSYPAGASTYILLDSIQCELSSSSSSSFNL